MNNIYTDVIVYKDRVGKLIEDKDYKFSDFIQLVMALIINQN